MISYNPNLPSKDSENFDIQLLTVLRDLGNRLNSLSVGSLYGVRGQATVAPTTGTWAKGDVIRNSAPTEAGVALAKYVIYGWICTVAGSPGTWLEIRTLTGN